MMKNNNRLLLLVCSLVLCALSAFAWFKAPDKYSLSERRPLAQKPVLTLSSLSSGKYMDNFDTFSADQFPMRDCFRRVKAIVSKYVFLQKDNNGLYSVDGTLSKLEYPLNEARVNANTKKIAAVCEQYLAGTDCKIYLSIIPDKNYYLADAHGYPAMDYEVLFSTVCSGVPADFIVISDLLDADAFYRTDPHWRQESIAEVAGRIGLSMLGAEYTPDNFDLHKVNLPFYGAYAGQSALPCLGDSLYYLTSPRTESCVVTSFNTGTAMPSALYDMAKASGRDPYEMFLGGSDALLVIENPLAGTDRELVVFRDSFGSSLIPLLCGQYKKITVVDLRYIRTELLEKYISFTDQDVLFIYSTMILNNTISQ